MEAKKLNEMSNEEKAALLTLLTTGENAEEVKEAAKKQEKEAKKAAEAAKKANLKAKAEAELKGKKANEIKARCIELLMAEYERAEKNAKKAGKAKGKAKEECGTCKASRCHTLTEGEEGWRPSMANEAYKNRNGKIVNNAFRYCGKKAVKGGELCAGCLNEAESSKWGECRNGIFMKPHSFAEVLQRAQKRKSDFGWVAAVWETYPEMKPEGAPIVTAEGIQQAPPEAEK